MRSRRVRTPAFCMEPNMHLKRHGPLAVSVPAQYTNHLEYRFGAPLFGKVTTLTD